MQIDLRAEAELPSQPLRGEVCIVGAGIAGLTLAHKLAGQGIDVLLLEAGGLGLEPEHQAVAAQVEMLGRPHAGSLEDRTHALGGSSLTWGGQLLPLPFASLDAPWPVSRTELADYQTEAERLLGVNAMPYDGPAFFRAAHAEPQTLFAGLSGLTPRVSKFAPFAQRNLADTLGSELLTHPRVRVVLHAAVEELLSPPQSAARVRSVVIRTPSGSQITVHADYFVLAAGTLETVRLLLASRSRHPAGLGNDHDQVGRYVHDHLTLTTAVFTGSARARLLHEFRPWVLAGPAGAVLHSAKLESSAQSLSCDDCAPMMAHLVFEEPGGSGIEAIRALLHARQMRISNRMAIRTALLRLPAAIGAATRLAWSARVEQRRYVSPQAMVGLRLNAAQSTPATSRISLSDRTDVSGQPLAALRWVISEHDCKRLGSFAEKLRASLSEQGFSPNEMRWAPALFAREGSEDSVPLPDLASHVDDARHLMGGAVMGTDPHTSVVDAELQLHGIANLHVASLAIFPDGRAQLPTLTLMALSLRLADRLVSALRTGSANTPSSPHERA